MRYSREITKVLSLLILSFCTIQAQPDRIPGAIDKSATVVLAGNILPLATPQNDEGAVEPSFRMLGVTVQFKLSASQQAAMDELLEEQQNPSSQNFHHWLTPEEYADRFGLSRNDIGKIRSWLASEGFNVDTVARGRSWIVFNGTAEQVQNTLHAEIHRFTVNGELRYANVASPAIPEALENVVSSFGGLNNIRPRASARQRPFTTNPDGSHTLAPDDLATIYDITPLYKDGIDGTGQKIAIVGGSDIKLSDIQAFRTKFNLPDQIPQIILVPGFPDPGFLAGVELEADLDLEWAGAIARNATIIYVYGGDPASYIIDQNLAPVLSESLGVCEVNWSASQFADRRKLAQQASAQGITWLVSSGDNGAVCVLFPDVFENVAQNGLGVNALASTPEIVGVGGTDFDSQSEIYWSAKNGPNGGSALSYIPETSWLFHTNPYGPGWGSGGGVSVFYPKPVWQAGPGVPSGDYRNVPDVALTASNYTIVSEGNEFITGGTSASTPTFAGVVALLNHYLVSKGIQSQPGVGNINPTLYRLAATVPGVFHDITTGNNFVPCAAGSPDCANGHLGYRTGPGYDRVTGLGSPDVSNLIHSWSTQPPSQSLVAVSLDQNPVYQLTAPDANGNSWSYVFTVAEEAGVGTTVTDFTVDGASHAAQIASLFGSSTLLPHGSLAANLGDKSLAVPMTRTFIVSGMDPTGRKWSQNLLVPFLGPQPIPSVVSAANGASFQEAYAPGMVLAVFGSQLASAPQAAAEVPLLANMGHSYALVNGVYAPFYYVSPSQLNVQIPYETELGAAVLQVGSLDRHDVNLGGYTFQVAASAPGIFVSSNGDLVPSASGARGKTLTMFFTGAGQVTPTIATGAAPDASTPVSKLPAPKLPVKLTVGGVQASIQFIGIPYGLVGVTQVNFQIADSTPFGGQPVIITVGAAASPPANLTITQ
jgi:uncharacterized protein (TIGR03437 family)